MPYDQQHTSPDKFTSRAAAEHTPQKGGAKSAVRAAQSRPAVVQMVKLPKDLFTDKEWDMLDEINGGYDDIETDALDNKLKARLKDLLTAMGKQDLADQVVEDAPVDIKKLRLGFANIAPPEASSAGRSTPSKKDDRRPGPVSPKMNQLWQEYYKKNEKEYTGEPEKIEALILADPVVNLLFHPPAVFLDTIGWKTMSIPHKVRGTDISVRVSLFGASMFTVQTHFPNGMQDTGFTYKSTGPDTFQVTEVYRHRSKKEPDAEGNFFIRMIEEQATGVSKLGKDVDYMSKAIRDEDSGAIGYNVWPKMGFDGEVPEKSLAEMIHDPSEKLQKGVSWLRAQKDPIRFSTMFSVADKEVYSQLKELWGKYGNSVEVHFDAQKDSASWKTLERYKQGTKENLQKLQP